MASLGYALAFMREIPDSGRDPLVATHVLAAPSVLPIRLGRRSPNYSQPDPFADLVWNPESQRVWLTERLQPAATDSVARLSTRFRARNSGFRT